MKEDSEAAAATGAAECISAFSGEVSRAAEMISEGACPSGASVGMSPAGELCAPIPFGSTEGESEEALTGAELASTGEERKEERNHESGAEADASCDGSAEGARPGIGVAIPEAFVFPGVNAGAVVIPGASARFVVWIAPPEPLPGWFVESTEDTLPVICGGAMGNGLTGMGSGIAGTVTRNAKERFNPAGSEFFVVPFAPDAFEGAVVVPVCGDTFEDTLGVGVGD